MKPPADFYKELPERTDGELHDMLAHPEDLLPEALEATRNEMIRRNLLPARTASPEADEELRALKIRVAEMESEKAELETKLKAKERNQKKEPSKAQGSWYAVFFVVSLLCFLGSYLAPSPEEARPMRMMGGCTLFGWDGRKGIVETSETIEG